MLELQKYFIGIYIILIGSLAIMVVAFLGCGAALMENTFLLFVVSGHICIHLFNGSYIFDHCTNKHERSIINITELEILNTTIIKRHLYIKSSSRLI